MNKSKHLLLSLSLVSIFAAMSLLALAEEQTVKKPAPKAQAVRPKGPAVESHPPTAPGHPIVGPGPHTVVGSGHPLVGPGGRGITANRGPHFVHDRSLWGDRERRAWAGGHWRPYECRFGRCGYWWMADGYWYFYDHPLEGPPDVVSDIEYADPSIEQVAAPPPGGEYAPPPPGPPPSSSAAGPGRGRRRSGRRRRGRHSRRRFDRPTGRCGCRRNRRRGDRGSRRRGSRAAAWILSMAGRLLLPISVRPIRRCRSPLLQLNGAASVGVTSHNGAAATA